MSASMLLKPRIMDPRRKDDISEVIGKVAHMKAVTTADGERIVPETLPSPGYMVNYYPPGLREATLGPHSKGLTGVSRFYPTLDPPVVVDFEPAPPDKWYFPEKLEFFSKARVLYIPVGLRDELTEEQFLDRYKEAKFSLDRFHQTAEETAALKNATLVEDVLAEPRVELLLDQIATARAGAERDRLGRPYRGRAFTHRLRAHKQQLVALYRGRLRSGVGSDDCYRELENEAQRPGDGQADPSRTG